MKSEMRGYSLAELIIVIAVIGVLVAVLIPAISFVVSKSVYASARSDAYNTAVDYEISSDDKASVLIFVHKYEKYYVFAYSDGELKSAGNRGCNGYSETFDELIEKYNYSEMDYSDLLYAIESGEISYNDAFGERFFRMSGSSELVLLDSPVNNFAALNSVLSDPLDNVEIYKGILLGDPEETHNINDDTTATVALMSVAPYQISYYSGGNQVYRTFILGREGECIDLYAPQAADYTTNNGRLLARPEGFPNYEFAGWSESPDAEDGFLTVVLGRIHNINLYAVWVEE